jgi:hypothetical protein
MSLPFFWLLDRSGQLVQRAFVHAAARLILAGLQIRDRHHRWRTSDHRHVFGHVGRSAEQCVETAAEAF